MNVLTGWPPPRGHVTVNENRYSHLCILCQCDTLTHFNPHSHKDTTMTLNTDKLKALAAKYGEHIVKIALDTAAHGFSIGYGPLHKKGMELTKTAPYIVHEDVAKMTETFGANYFLDCANGQSGRVRDQTLREDIWDDKSLASRPEEMVCILIARALGTKRTRKVTVIEKRIYVAEDGSEFENKDEFLAYQKELQNS